MQKHSKRTAQTHKTDASEPVKPFGRLGKPPAGVDRASHALRYGGAAMLRTALAMMNRLGQLEPSWLDDHNAQNAYLLINYMADARSHAETPGGGRRPRATLRITMPDDTYTVVQGYKAAAEIVGRNMVTVQTYVRNGNGRAHFARKGSQQVYTVERL